MWHSVDSFIQSISSRKVKSILKAILLSALCVALTYQLFSPTYLTNDDPGYAYILSGKLIFNQATAYILFQHIFITAPIAYLIQQYPQIPWYPYFQISLLFICLTTLNYIILYRFKNSTGFIASLLLYLCFFSFLFLNLHFTVSAFTLSITAFVLLTQTDEIIHKRKTAIYILLLLLLSSMLRWEAWLFSMLWIGLYFGIRLFLQYRKRRIYIDYKYVASILIISAVLCYAFKQINKQYYKSSGNEDYRTFNYYRAHLNDYNDLKYITKAERKKILDANGWSENDYLISLYWLFMDRNLYSCEKIEHIVEDVDQTTLFRKRITTNCFNLKSYFLRYENLQYYALLCCLVWLFFAHKRRAFWIFFTCQALFALTTITKKYPPESFYIASFLLFPYFLVYDSFVNKRKYFLIMALCILAYFQWQELQKTSNKHIEQQAILSNQFKVLDADTAHIYYNWGGIDLSNSNPLKLERNIPSNIIFGGTFAAHPLNLAKIKALGIQDFMREIGTNPKMLVIFKEKDKDSRTEIDYAVNAYLRFAKEHFNLDLQVKMLSNTQHMSIWDFSPADTNSLKIN